MCLCFNSLGMTKQCCYGNACKHVILFAFVIHAGYFEALQNGTCVGEKSCSSVHFNGEITQEQTRSSKTCGQLACQNTLLIVWLAK